MNELFEVLFDENILKTNLREKWIKLYDYNYVDKEVIGNLLLTKNKIQDLLDFVHNKATVGVGSKDINKEEDKKVEDESIKQPQKQIKKPKVTIPEPFHLSENKPRVFKEPEEIPNNFKIVPVPLADFKKTSLKEIEEKRKERLDIIKQNVLEKHSKAKKFEFETDKRPMNLPRIAEEQEQKIAATLQFNNKYCKPLKDFSKDEVKLNTNEAAILREEYLISKKQKEEAEALKKILIEKKDSKEYERWVREMELKDDILKMQEIEKRKLELELNREVASTYKQRREQENLLKQREHKKREEIHKKQRNKIKEKELQNKRELVKEINKEKDNITRIKKQNQDDKQNLYKNRKKEYNELNLIAQQEKEIELQRRDDLIRQIRELEKLPMKRTTGFDPTETPGYGLLEEMSIVELRERLALQKQMLKDEILSKKEENNLRKQEKKDEINHKWEIIQQTRDALKQQKDAERKLKHDAFIAEKERQRIANEKSLKELRQKIKDKKEKKRIEDEKFRNKIREIALTRQFMKQGGPTIEEKRIMQVEEAAKRKIRDKENQDLFDMLASTKVRNTEITMRYNDAKNQVKNTKNLLANYQHEYTKSKGLNEMALDEDALYKKAVYDRERALNKFLKDELREKNKFSDAMQQRTFKRDTDEGKNILMRSHSEGRVGVNQMVSGVPEENLTSQEFDDEDNNDIEAKLKEEEEQVPA